MRTLEELIKRKKTTASQYKRNSQDGVNWEKLGFTFNFVNVGGGIMKSGFVSQTERSDVIIDDFQCADASVAVSDFEKFRKAHPDLLKRYPKNFLSDAIAGAVLSATNAYKPITGINALEVFQFVNYVNYIARKEQGVLEMVMEEFLPYVFEGNVPHTRICPKDTYYVADQWALEYIIKGGARPDTDYPYFGDDIVVINHENKEVAMDGSEVHPIVAAYDHTEEYHGASRFPEGKKYFPKLNEPVCIRPEYGVPKGELDYQPNNFNIYHASANVMKITASRKRDEAPPPLFTSMYSNKRPNVPSSFDFETFNDVKE